MNIHDINTLLVNYASKYSFPQKTGLSVLERREGGMVLESTKISKHALNIGCRPNKG